MATLSILGDADRADAMTLGAVSKRLTYVSILCDGLMPTKQKREAQEEQAKRFIREAQRLIDAGELNPTEADAALDRVVRNGSLEPKEGSSLSR